MQSRLPILFILITVVIDSMGIGLILPVMPSLIQQIDGGSLASAAVWGGILSTGFAVMQFLFGPVVGALSDRYGRRPILLTALFVMTLDYLVMAAASTLWALLILRLINGITASTQSTATAYMADISQPGQKAARFGLIGAAFGIGFVLGPVIGGLLAEYGTRAPFFAAAALAFTNMLFGYFVLPETVTDRIRRPFTWTRANPFGAIRSIGHLPGTRLAMTVFLLSQVAFFVYPAVWAYFSAERFGWSPGMIGVSLAAFGGGMIVVQGVLMRPLVKRLGEVGTGVLGLIANLIAYATLAFVTSGTLALMLVPFGALGGMVNPAIQALMSRRAADDQQGELQGVLTSLGALAAIVSPVLMTRTFAAFTAADAPFYLPGAPFLLSAALTVICLLLVASLRRRRTGAAPLPAAAPPG